MTPIACFDSAWARCDQLGALYAYFAPRLTGALVPDELLRAEWVARVSALDMFVHELVAQRMVEVFEGRRRASGGYLRFQLSLETATRIRNAARNIDASAAFDLEVRQKLGFQSFQDPAKIADGIRLFSDCSLWKGVASFLGASVANQEAEAKDLKMGLSLIVERRNKIAHEGDLQPAIPRVPWPIAQSDLIYVKDTIGRIVRAIDGIT